jgi:hypothetical protein
LSHGKSWLNSWISCLGILMISCRKDSI